MSNDSPDREIIGEAAAKLENSENAELSQDEYEEFLRSCSREQWNLVINSTDVIPQKSVIFEGKREFKGNYRVKGLEILGQRAKEMDLAVKVNLCCQLSWKDLHEQNLVCQILCSTFGSELTSLKIKIDSSGRRFDLKEMLIRFPKELKVKILSHFSQQALVINGETLNARPLKILSDVDDTLRSQLLDYSFPSGTVYPGVLEFYDGLDRGPEDKDLGNGGNLIFLTARPSGVKGFFRFITARMLEGIGVGEHTSKAAVLHGSLSTLLSNNLMASKKFENFVLCKNLYPEFRFVFIGDSGQGDLDLARRIISLFGREIARVYIHDIVDKSNCRKHSTEKREEYLKKYGVYFFDSYLSAGVDAFEQGLLSRRGLQKIHDGIQSSLNSINFQSEEQRQSRTREFEDAREKMLALFPTPEISSTQTV